jgi:sulfate permease, SulP family
MRFIENPPKVLIIRMRKVPIIDAAGIKTIDEIHKESKQKGTKLEANVTDTFQEAIDRSRVIFNDH